VATGSGPRRRADVADQALSVLGRTQLRLPDSLPDPSLPLGTDTIPEIGQVVVLMMENHSYDNFFGMLGRAPGQQPRGDGFRLGSDGLPTATNPYPDGALQRAFRMPTTCQLAGTPSQEWAASHNAFDNGSNDGFVRTTIDPDDDRSYTSEIVGPVAMGYWTGDDLPLTYSLANTFPIGDRWFCSLLGQTDPNRRYLIAGTSRRMTDDIGSSPNDAVADSTLGIPAANGTIFQRLSDAWISWADYNASFPTGATMALYPANDGAHTKTNTPPLSQFFDDAKAGTLPQFSLLDPDYSTQSQENPQNIVVGEAFSRTGARCAPRLTALAQDRVRPRLRRARRLLRPRSASCGARARRDPAARGEPRRADLRWLLPVRLPGPIPGPQPVRETELRQPRCLRPHLDPRVPRA
jgi:phospholipase C